ncbi:hypothetical protein [Rickettsiales endosymbiont of Trichoplax sp. H2]|uniref:hypothetical protein n=1 Tax=Rickettsiales endosymbiont of Trichoplax sp. H2 TaxID=2021221 RepID=UPI0018A82041|nr:hypothetical protein [Rickettsiales endosymbiont of Trichoplax sp. H2]MSO13710.1 hypothetical protein [Rickettsiales endosymbiont of Trichoplax sp. H2]
MLISSKKYLCIILEKNKNLKLNNMLKELRYQKFKLLSKKIMNFDLYKSLSLKEKFILDTIKEINN